MVKLNKTSKRVPCKRRYKIEKRIKDHNRKVKKEEKKKPKQKQSKMKNWHIPNKCPFKNELLNQAEDIKKQKLKEREEKKLQAKLNRAAQADKPKKTLEQMKAEAERKQSDFDMQLEFAEASKPDGVMLDENIESSSKSFYKEFKKIVELSDVIIEVLDARDPMGTRCPQVEQMILNSGRQKKLILLLNKIDLVPKENIQKWLKYLRSQYPTVAFKSSTQNQKERLAQSKVTIESANEKLLNSSKCFGADILVKLLKNYCRNSDIKQAITVGIVGLPNTGKSSLINSLKRSHACQFGATPGLTRHVQEVKLDKHIKLLDSPGIVISKDGDVASLALKNCVRIEQLEDPVSPVELILKKCKRDDMMVHYKVSFYKDVGEFLSLLALRSGKIKKGGVPDTLKAAKQVLIDWNNGKLPYYTHPPEESRVTETKIVTEMGKAFDIDSILEDEEKLLKAIDDTKLEVDGMEIEPSEPARLDSDDSDESCDE